MGTLAQVQLTFRGKCYDRSGTITEVDGTQILSLAKDTRQYIFVQNPSIATESLFVNVGDVADPNDVHSIELLPGQSWWRASPGWVPNETIYIGALTLTHAFVAKEA